MGLNPRSNPPSVFTLAGANGSAARLVGAAMFLFTALLFARAYSNGFVNYDDPDYVTANDHVRTGLTVANARWALTASVASNWHPLTWISHQVDVSIFGLNPRGHHATGVLLHALSAVLSFFALRRLTGALWSSAFCAALFALHPLRVESVAWVAERKDVLSGGFFFLSLWAYATYAKFTPGTRGRSRAYGLTLVAFALGLMSKPMPGNAAVRPPATGLLAVATGG